MKAVAGPTTEQNNRKALVLEADEPSSRSGTATGPRLLTQAPFSLHHYPYDACEQQGDCVRKCEHCLVRYHGQR